MNKKKVPCRQLAHELPEWAELRILNARAELNGTRNALLDANRRVQETDRRLRREVWTICRKAERRRRKWRIFCGNVFILALLGCIGAAGGVDAGTLPAWVQVIPLGLAAAAAWIGGWAL